jgi:hypothetical protein
MPVKVTESILLETEPFDPARMAEIMSALSDLIHQSEAVSYTVVKSSIKTDTPQWVIAVLMRRPACTPDEWLLTVEALAQEAPF